MEELTAMLTTNIDHTDK